MPLKSKANQRFARSKPKPGTARATGRKNQVTKSEVGDGNKPLHLSRAMLDILIRETPLHPAAEHIPSKPPFDLQED